ncbi:MAG: hypothetical protein J6X69_07010 [Bacteroidales bacterium]|nr:hypothetical protein [Bacteroidales bacterium]
MNGRCYYKNKSKCDFPGTPGQNEQLEVHRRALAAWRTLDHSVQLIWNSLAEPVISHQPPFDNTAHISGHNLFVSAYHGFYTLGDEHVPTPQPWEKFPVYAVEFLSCDRPTPDDLRLHFNVTFENCERPDRYQLLFKLQLTKSGGGKNKGKMRNFLSVAPCSAADSTVDLLIPDYRAIWDLDLPAYQVHCWYLLLDRQTGYRNIHTTLSFPISL